MRFKSDFYRNYLSHAPAALALERSLECEILSRQEFRRPILDIGCGDGVFASILFKEKIDTGIDPDRKELKRAERYHAYKETIACFGNKIPKKSGSYHTVFSNSVLEHIKDLKPVLKEAHRLLSKTGSFYVTIPTDAFDKYNLFYRTFSALHLHSLAERYRRFYNRFWKHHHYYTPQRWKAFFKSQGFRTVNTFRYSPKNCCLIHDLCVPLAAPSAVTKRLFDRWILLPSLRRYYSYPFYLASRHSQRDSIDVPDGGLIFFHLKKR